MEAFEKKERLVWIALKRAAMDVWLDWIATFIHIHNGFKLRTVILAIRDASFSQCPAAKPKLVTVTCSTGPVSLLDIP